MPPLVSILIPAYNAEKWIRETLRSAIDQDYPYKEIILVNDGSTDNTLAMAKVFESAFVKIVHQSNAGGPAARNTALALAQGDYIQWLDHDDLLAPDKISRQLLERIPGSERVLFSGSFGTFYFRAHKAVFSNGPLCRDLTPLEYFQIKFAQNTYFQTSSWLVSRKLTEMAGPWWEVRSPDDDGEYFCRVVAASRAIRYVPEAKSYWRVGNYGSFSSAWTHSPSAREATFQSMCKCIDHFRAFDDSESSRSACVQFLQDRLIYFYPDNPEIVARARSLAAELGGALTLPRVGWKYRLVKEVFGWNAVKRAQILGPRLRVGAERAWDRLMYNISMG